MKKAYIAPQVEDIKMDNLMVDYLDIATVSGGEATVTGGQGA